MIGAGRTCPPFIGELLLGSSIPVSGKGFVAIVCSSTELPGYWIGAGAAVTGKDVQHAPKNLNTIQCFSKRFNKFT